MSEVEARFHYLRKLHGDEGRQTRRSRVMMS